MLNRLRNLVRRIAKAVGVDVKKHLNAQDFLFLAAMLLVVAFIAGSIVSITIGTQGLIFIPIVVFFGAMALFYWALK